MLHIGNERLTMENILRILVVDDNTEVRNDLRLIVNLIDGVEVIGEADTAGDAVQKANDLKPALIIMDLELGKSGNCEMDGPKATRMIKKTQPGTIIFVLTVHDYESARQAAFQAGTDAFFVKGIEINDMLNAIRNLRPIRSDEII